MDSRRAVTITGMNWGDEGKGTITEWCARKNNATLVIRHNGGGQAAHRIVLPDGREHVFSQWGSGTFAGARTFLSEHMVVHPIAMLNEAKHLTSVGVQNPYDLITVSPQARVATPYHQEMNRLREAARGEGRHGSCGMGIGEAAVDAAKPHAITWGDLTNYAAVRAKLRIIRDDKMAEATDLGTDPSEAIARLQDVDFERAVELMQLAGRLVETERDEEHVIDKHRSVVFEGAQGVLLDQDHGFHPYTTWSRCTDGNALDMLRGKDFEVTRVGVVRAYATKHGPGPFPTYDAELTEKLPDAENRFNEWQREFRCGWFDVALTKYAVESNGGVDCLAVTNMDRLTPEPGLIESVGPRIAIASYGPTHLDKRER